MARTKQITAVRKTIREARKSKSFTAAHEALCSVAVGIAEQIDSMTGEDVPGAALWKELRAAVESLAMIAAEGADDPDSEGADLVGLPKMGN